MEHHRMQRHLLMKQRKELIEGRLRPAFLQRSARLSDGLIADRRVMNSLIERRKEFHNEIVDLERSIKELKTKKQQQRALFDAAVSKKNLKKRELESIKMQAEKMKTLMVEHEEPKDASCSIVGLFERFVGLAVQCDDADCVELRVKTSAKEGRISVRRSPESGRFEVVRCEPPIAQVPDLSDRFADGRQWGAVLVALRAALQPGSRLPSGLSPPSE